MLLIGIHTRTQVSVLSEEDTIYIYSQIKFQQFD